MNVPVPHALHIDTRFAPASPGDRLCTWLAGLNPNTRRAYQRDLARFATFCDLPSEGTAITALCSVDRRTALGMVEAFKANMIARKLAPATINRPLSTINSTLRHLAKAEYGPGPLDVSGVRAEAKKDSRGPEPSAIKAVIARLSADDEDLRSARDLAIVRLAAQRGLRRSEIAGLTLADIDVRRGEIWVKRKGATQRVRLAISQPIGEALAAWIVLRARVAGADEDSVFLTLTDRPDQHGLPLSANAIYKIIRGLGGDGWRPHGLRHAAITAVLMRTNNLEAARILAGHRSVMTTSRYIDDKLGLEKMAIAALEGAFALK